MARFHAQIRFDLTRNKFFPILFFLFRMIKMIENEKNKIRNKARKALFVKERTKDM